MIGIILLAYFLVGVLVSNLLICCTTLCREEFYTIMGIGFCMICIWPFLLFIGIVSGGIVTLFKVPKAPKIIEEYEEEYC